MKQRFPGRHGLRHIYRSTQTLAVTEGNEGDHQNPFDRHCSGHPCRLPVPARTGAPTLIPAALAVPGSRW